MKSAPLLSCALVAFLAAPAATAQVPEPFEPNFASLCVDNGRPVGTVEIIRGLHGARKKGCPRRSTEYRVETAHIVPHQSDITAGVVPPTATSATRHYDFRVLLRDEGGHGGPMPTSATLARLSNSLSADVSCINTGAGVRLSWFLNADIDAVAFIGPQHGPNVHLPQPDLEPATFQGGVVDTFTTQEVPGLHVVATDGSEIRISNARAHLFSDVADCIATGTLTVIGVSVVP
jgi:hypothetical protein